jgi:hypothetical protein
MHHAGLDGMIRAGLDIPQHTFTLLDECFRFGAFSPGEWMVSVAVFAGADA